MNRLPLNSEADADKGSLIGPVVPLAEVLELCRQLLDRLSPSLCIVSRAVGPSKTDVVISSRQLEPRPLEDWAFGKRSPLGWLLLLVIILLILAIMAIMDAMSK